MYLVALAVGALSCHRPTPAEGPDPTTGEPSAIEPAPIEPEVYASASPSLESPRRAQRARVQEKAPLDPTPLEPVSLCCDEFAGGLCFRAPPDACRAQTSQSRSCPALSVREIRDRDGRAAWVCAEPD